VVAAVEETDWIGQSSLGRCGRVTLFIDDDDKEKHDQKMTHDLLRSTMLPPRRELRETKAGF